MQNLTQVICKKLLFITAVILISLFFLENTAFSVNTKEEKNNNKSDISLFSSSVSFSQQDFKKEDITSLMEDNIKKDVNKGVVSMTSSNVAVCISERNVIEGQDFKEGDETEQEKRRKVIEYIVKQGDTVSGVATTFGLRVQTLLWANNLDILTIIRPGDKLTIPPEDGVMYKVKRGDTLLAIAQKYNSKKSEIIEFNQLDSPDSIVEGQMLFLPGGRVPAPSPPPLPTRQSSSLALTRPRSSSSRGASIPVVRRGSGGGHRFPYGYCTWYVAQKRGGVPWGGNAKDWLANARAAGYATGSQPTPGAIMVTRESWWGHVAYVESVSGDSVTISEMNLVGWGRVNTRTLNKNDWVIRGYIY